MIDQMMFLSPHPLPIENLVRVYGLHEKFLNNLVSRYDEELISCLLEHINTPACQVIIFFFFFFEEKIMKKYKNKIKKYLLN